MKITIELDAFCEIFELKQLLSELQPRLPDGVPVSKLGLDHRTENALRKEGMTEVSQLLGKADSDFLKIPSIGRTSLNEIRHALKAKGFEVV